MTQQKSKLICLCGTEGGVLKRRRAGNSRRKTSLYQQHYDPTKKTRKRQCYVSRQNIALIHLKDERYSSKKYKTLVKRYLTIFSDYYRPPDNARVNLLEGEAYKLLCAMGWPDKVVKAVEKFRADAREVFIVEKLPELRERSGDDFSREKAFKRFFSRKRALF